MFSCSLRTGITTEQRIPSANAKFEEVKDRVVADYKLQQATLKARELGQGFAKQLTNSLATGKSFTETCSAAGYPPVLLPPFSLSTRSLPELEEHASLGMFKQVAFATPVRSASGFNFTSDGGYVLYVASVLPTDAPPSISTASSTVGSRSSRPCSSRS